MTTRLESDSTFTGDYAHDFEVWAEYYNSQPEIDTLNQYSDLSDKKVLEGGCGSGRLSFRISDESFSLTSVDIVPSLITHCHEKLIQEFEGDQTRLRFEVQDLLDLPYPDNHFDVILDGWTFSTLEDFDQGAAEYKRVLAEDGTILAIEFQEGSTYDQIIDKFVPDDAFEEELPPPDTMMKNAFGQPDVTKIIESEHRFASVEEAFNAFWFHFTEWMELDLSDEHAEALIEKLESYQTEEGVHIGETAKFYKYTNPK